MVNADISSILRAWGHDATRVNARIIQGDDGRDKVQLRLDLGILQMELDGRPDGQKPEGRESWFEYYKDKHAEHEAQHGDDDDFILEGEDCARLQMEAVQYYHRYLSLFQIEDWTRVARDTRRNLDLFDFVSEFAEHEEMAWSFLQFRPYVLMMNTRSSAMLHLQKGNIQKAIRRIEKGVAEIEEFLEETSPEDAQEAAEMHHDNGELKNLREWLEELRDALPQSPAERIRRQLQDAIAREEYETAARLRDELATLQSAEVKE